MPDKRTQQMKALQAEIAELEASIAQERSDIKAKAQRIVKLKEAAEVLEREKWSYQSELENLRGY